MADSLKSVLAEVHGNRTHLSRFSSRHTGFEVPFIENFIKWGEP